MDEACENGNLEIVKTLGVPINKFHICLAILNEHFEIVKYLVSINAPISEYAIKCAEKGYNELEIYLTSINSPINFDEIYQAAIKGYPSLVQYLSSINAPINGTAMGFINYLEITKYLLWSGAPYFETKHTKFLKKELKLEIEPIVSEIIGPDISSIIIQIMI